MKEFEHTIGINAFKEGLRKNSRRERNTDRLVECYNIMPVDGKLELYDPVIVVGGGIWGEYGMDGGEPAPDSGDVLIETLGDELTTETFCGQVIGYTAGEEYTEIVINSNSGSGGRMVAYCSTEPCVDISLVPYDAFDEASCEVPEGCAVEDISAFEVTGLENAEGEFEVVSAWIANGEGFEALVVDEVSFQGENVTLRVANTSGTFGVGDYVAVVTNITLDEDTCAHCLLFYISGGNPPYTIKGMRDCESSNCAKLEHACGQLTEPNISIGGVTPGGDILVDIAECDILCCGEANEFITILSGDGGLTRSGLCDYTFSPPEPSLCADKVTIIQLSVCDPIDTYTFETPKQCDDTPYINYSTTMMLVGTTQVLSIAFYDSECGLYISLDSGVGTLSNLGDGLYLYTAPGSNPECNNPTFSLHNVCDAVLDSLVIAVTTGTYTAGRLIASLECLGSGCGNQFCREKYNVVNCIGEVNYEYTATGTCAGGWVVCSGPWSEELLSCPPDTSLCSSCFQAGEFDDTRTPADISAGCCPPQAL